jgi:DNA modification methylase
MKPYYERDGITIFHGDCREVLPTLGPVDHVITDPPYEAEAHQMARRQTREHTVAEYEIEFGQMDAELRAFVGGECARLAGGWILVFCQVEAAMIWRDALFPARYFRTQIWRKPDGAPQFTGDRPGMGYESIVTCWNSARRGKWNGGGRHGVYEHCVNNFGRLTSGRPHPTMKPIALMTELVSLFTDPGETILDPFMGSGTTLRAAKDLGRKAIGIEISEAYCEIAARRLDQQVLSLDFQQVEQREGGFQPPMLSAMTRGANGNEVAGEMGILQTLKETDGE